MQLSRFREFLGLMSRACQALSQAKKASDQNNVPVYREELEKSRQFENLAKHIDDNEPAEKASSGEEPVDPGA